MDSADLTDDMNVARVEAVDIITENRSFVGLASLAELRVNEGSPEKSQVEYIRKIPTTDSYDNLQTRDVLLHRRELPQKGLIRVGNDYTDTRINRRFQT